MNNITFEEMQQIQHELRDKYGKWWGDLNPDQGARTLLWLIGEASEVGDIIKKQGELINCISDRTSSSITHHIIDGT